MASALRSRLTTLLSTAQKTVEPAASFIGKEVSTRYDKLLKDNAQYVVKDKAAADKLLRQWFFTRLSRWVSDLQFLRWEAVVLVNPSRASSLVPLAPICQVPACT